MTDEAAIGAVIDGGADAAGFVLAPTSPRCLSVDRAARLMDGLPVARFIVVVDWTVAEALQAADTTGADGIQAHGLHASDVATAAIESGYLTLYPISVAPSGLSESLQSVDQRMMPILDAYSHSRHGGTGKTFDWSLIDDPGRPYVLAGGLGPDNVAEAIATLKPFGVDASSKLESVRGVKDPSSIHDFIERAKQS